MKNRSFHKDPYARLVVGSAALVAVLLASTPGVRAELIFDQSNNDARNGGRVNNVRTQSQAAQVRDESPNQYGDQRTETVTDTRLDRIQGKAYDDSAIESEYGRTGGSGTQVIVNANPYVSQDQNAELENVNENKSDTNVASSLDSLQGADVSSSNRAEQIRRMRVHQEMRNEDDLQTRLERNRLREEERRSQMIAQFGDEVSVVQTQHSRPAPQTDTIIVTEAAPVRPVIVAETNEGILGDSGVMIAPKAGIADMKNGNAYTVDPRMSAGFELGFVVNQYATIVAGYSYNVYDVYLNNFGNNTYQPYSGYNWNNYYNQSIRFDHLVMKQNVFEIGTKVHALSKLYRFRPFAKVGVGYAKSFVNYDAETKQELNRFGWNEFTQDYEGSSWMGTLGLGLDAELTDFFAISAQVNYYFVTSSGNNRSQQVRGYQSAQQTVGPTLVNSDFYTGHIGATFNF